MKVLKSLFVLLFFISLASPVNASSGNISNTEETYIFADFGKVRNLENSSYIITPYMWIGYSIKNITANGLYTIYSIPIKSGKLSPGGSNTFSVSYSRTTTISGVLSVGPSDFNTTIGISSSSAVSISDSYSYVCPNSVSGRIVKSCTVTYYPLIQKYKFDEYFGSSKSGVGYAEALTGFTQSVTFGF